MVDHCSGGFNADQSDSDRISIALRALNDPETDRPAEPGCSRKPVGIMVTRAFNMQAFEGKRFDKANLDLTAIMLFINRLMVIMMPLMMLIMSGGIPADYLVGSHEVAQANMQVGDMMAFYAICHANCDVFLMLSMMFIILPRASVSGDRLLMCWQQNWWCLTLKSKPIPRTF